MQHMTSTMVGAPRPGFLPAHIGPNMAKIALNPSTIRPGSRAMVRVAQDLSASISSDDGIAHEKVFSYEPSVWGDFFINYGPQPLQRSEEWMRWRADKLKENVRMLFQTSSDVVAKMNLVDAVQHLGIGHLFKDEISYTLRDIHRSEFTSSSLHEVALRFRLLREHGLWVSPDAFNKFKGDDGRFIDEVANEPRGLLSLYNAAYLLVHDEPELEEAISFSRHHLTSMLLQGNYLKHPLVDQVSRALHLPLARTCKRVEALYYISEYQQEERHIPILLDLAKLDFNLLQGLHLKELKAISEWWKDLYGYIGLSYLRDRVVESYTWSYMLFFEEGLALTRMICAKLIALIVIMDDTYDAHATIHESRKLNEAIQRWDESAISLLPEYLKKFYRKLLNNFKEFEDQVAVNEKYRVAYAKKEFQKLSHYYLQEAEWLHQNHKPSFQEHVALSTMTSAMQLVSVSTTVGRGDTITKEAFQWTTSSTTIIACAKILRFMNDIAAFKQHGKNKGDIASTVECYMNEHKVSSEVALTKLSSLIEDEWRTMNQAYYEHLEILPAVQRVVNLAASIMFIYDKRKDAYTFSSYLEEIIKSLFVKPVPM
ncbi:tau-cadinol synthase-like isoform X1 [Oryza glaberrima]|uniref:tau-cadinol synthase-like isoform X1 n=1 Tax=Oryza glaberrima TaxID=4538 RepID=UPI00224BF1F1|nr:tau-cadinol synthase-like isoform X1 [Oryza glaberrima]